MFQIPALCEELTGRNAMGPNCWNATMLALGVTDEVRFVSCREMNSWLDEMTFQVEEHEIEPGDILVMRATNDIWEGPNGLIHTAVLIEGDRYWHKPGSEWIIGWEYQTLENIKKVYFMGDKLSYRRYNRELAQAIGAA